MKVIKKILVAFITLIACVSCNQKLEVATDKGSADFLPKGNLHTYATLTKRANIASGDTRSLPNLVFDSVPINLGNAYNKSIGTYEVKRDGYYNVSAVVNFPPYPNATTANASCTLYVFVNSVDLGPVHFATGAWPRAQPCTASASTILQLRKGQTIYFKTLSTIGGAPAEDNQTYFFGYLSITELTLKEEPAQAAPPTP